MVPPQRQVLWPHMRLHISVPDAVSLGARSSFFVIFLCAGVVHNWQNQCHISIRINS
jgi:hypothetical protein